MSTNNTPSAGKRFYDTIELRQQVISQLDQKDLASFIKVEKKGMALVAGKLYHTMKYRHVKSRMSMSSPRSRMYCDAVTVVDARGLTMTPAMYRDLKLPQSYGRRRACHARRWMKSYHPELIDLIVPFLRRKCPGLRRVFFGSEYEYSHSANREYASWTLDIDAALTDYHMSDRIEGTVDLVGVLTALFNDSSSEVEMWTPEDDFSEWQEPLAPESYTLRRRFNLKLHTDWSLSSEQWNKVLLKDSRFEHTYKAVDFDDVAIDMATIRHLCLLQSRNGHPDRSRIEYFNAPSATPFVIDEFRSLAIASNSLSYLNLGRSSDLSYDDLGDLITIIRSELPVLRTLELSIRDFDDVESDCSDLLSPTTIRTGGTIKNLTMHGSRTGEGNLYNTLRSLSALVTKNVGKICITGSLGTNDYYRRWIKERTAFVRYLLSQSHQSREHLSVVDFASLGVQTLPDISRLVYDDQGQPQPLIAIKA